MDDFVVQRINTAREELVVAIRLAGQRSYHRRAPSSECLPHYAEAKRILSEILTHDSRNREALLLMSQISEGLMDFDAAAVFLLEAFDAGEPKSKKSLKRLALLRENANWWNELALTPEQLCELGKYLESRGVGPADRSLDITREWLSLNFKGDPEEVIAGLDEHGAFSDFQVLANVVYG